MTESQKDKDIDFYINYVENLPEVNMGKLEKYVKLPLLAFSMIFLGFTGLFIDTYEYVSRYHGGPHIIFDESYHYYPLILMISSYMVYVLRLFLEGFILKIFPPPPSERKAVHLRWDMVMTSFAFVYIQIQVFIMMHLRIIGK